MNTNEEIYTTTDLYTTAVLISKKFPIINVSVEGPNKKVKRFHFLDTPELKAVVLEYMNRSLQGNIREFRDAIETVKDVVHSG